MFNQDNRVMILLNKLTDLIILSCMWLVSCLPVFTAGAACASAYNAVIKVVRRDSSQMFQEYWDSFRGNLKGTWLPTLALDLVALGFVFIAARLWAIRDSFLGGAYFFMSCFFLLTVAIYAVHLFCLCGRFSLPLRGTLKVALWMSFSKPLNNLLLGFVMLGLVWMTLTWWPLVFLLPGLFFWFLTHLEEPAFHRFINYEDDLEDRKRGKDAEE